MEMRVRRRLRGPRRRAAGGRAARGRWSRPRLTREVDAWRSELLRAATWRASRHGLADRPRRPGDARPRPRPRRDRLPGRARATRPSRRPATSSRCSALDRAAVHQRHRRHPPAPPLRGDRQPRGGRVRRRRAHRRFRVVRGRKHHYWPVEGAFGLGLPEHRLAGSRRTTTENRVLVVGGAFLGWVVTRHHPPTWLPLAAVGCTLVFWASAFVAIRHLGHDFSAGALSLGRLLVGLALPRRRRGLDRLDDGRRLPRPTPSRLADDRDDRGALVRGLQRGAQPGRAAGRRRHGRDADPGLAGADRVPGGGVPRTSGSPPTSPSGWRWRSAGVALIALSSSGSSPATPATAATSSACCCACSARSPTRSA